MSGRPTSVPSTSRRLAAGPRRSAAALVAGVLLLAGCGGDDGGGGGAAPSADPSLGTVTVAADGVQEVTIETPDDYVFLPDEFTVAPGPVRLTVRNTAEQMVHNFRFTPDTGPAEIAAEIPLLQPGESDTIEFEVQAEGDYPFDCSFHLQLGQVGTMTVAAA
ncbi:plastocyanin/azurin family copper-binding protein [Trujillonella endophytica]|uniref:Plastocyanin n=1 Tax=Trujillonella endophytica TaxID=673521 RepID=A0A1H8WB09_9ACTN|nr:plastocyanin/azurin family copper-binding protein [Trujillella endophytica]SEP24693.1 Plastocyanin [Trujillella endophytica]